MLIELLPVFDREGSKELKSFVSYDAPELSLKVKEPLVSFLFAPWLIWPGSKWKMVSFLLERGVCIYIYSFPLPQEEL